MERYSNVFQSGNIDKSECWYHYEFHKWADIFVVVLFAYGWNLGIILWLLPWRRKFSYLGATLEPLFQSEANGISLKNWRQLGHARLDVDYIRQLANRKDYQFYVFILCLNIWILFFAKLAMVSSWGQTYYHAFNKNGFSDFFNIEIALITLLMISTEFFAFSVLPALQVGAQFSNVIKVFLYSIYLECVITFILLCIQWPILISVLYIGACIVLTGMILSMAVLCLLAGVIIVGAASYWALYCLCFWLPYYYGSQWKVNIRVFAASITWLFITLLVWVIGVCLAFLFTQDQFDSVLCLQSSDSNEMVAATLVLTSVIITVLSLIFIWVAHFTKWDCSELLDFGSEQRALSRLGARRSNDYQTVSQTDTSENDDEKALTTDDSAAQMSEDQLKAVVDNIPDSDHEA